MSINSSFSYSSTKIAATGLTTADVTQKNRANVTPKTPKQSEYVFRVLDRHRDTPRSIQIPQQSTNKSSTPIQTNTNDSATFLLDIQSKWKKTNITNHDTPSKKYTSNTENENESQIRRLNDQVITLKNRVTGLSEENIKLKKMNEQLGSLTTRNDELQGEIQRIKNQYVQTSLDCFQEALRGEYLKIATLKRELQIQTFKTEQLQSSLSLALQHNKHLAAELKTKAEMFGRQMKSQEQRFQVKLSDKQNQIQDLRHSLQTLGQRYRILVNEVKSKDEFLMSLGQKKL